MPNKIIVRIEETLKGSEGRGYTAYVIQSQHNMLYYNSERGDFVAQRPCDGLTFWEKEYAVTFVNAQGNWVLEEPE